MKSKLGEQPQQSRVLPLPRQLVSVSSHWPLAEVCLESSLGREKSLGEERSIVWSSERGAGRLTAGTGGPFRGGERREERREERRLLAELAGWRG